MSVSLSVSRSPLCEAVSSQKSSRELRPGLELSLLDDLPVALLQLDPHGVIQHANKMAKKCLGVTLKGKLWREVCRLVFHRLDQGDLRSVDGRLYSISTAPIAAYDGQIIMLTDISENRRLQKQAAGESRLVALGEMVARLAHQVRTPLSAAMLYLGQLQRLSASTQAPQADTRQAYIVQRLHERLHTIETMVQDMLMFTQTRARASVKIELQSVIDSLHQQFDELFTYRGGQLTSELRTQVALSGNPIALSSALGNLLSNALDVRDRGVCAHLCIFEQNGEVCIEVHDNGPGVSEELAESLFEPFFTTKVSGNGLGLPVVKTVVENHSGAISVGKSEHLGGACFRIVVPVCVRCD